MNNPEKILCQGAEILARKLDSFGFHFSVTASGTSSGGPCANGEFRNGDRTLMLSVRNGLGLVYYRKDSTDLAHEDYMRALGRHREARYPSAWSGDRMAAFKDLLADLEACSSFLEGDGTAFLKIAKSYVPPPKGFAGLSKRL